MDKGPARKKEEIEIGDTTIVKDGYGTTHIHIHNLNINITADVVQQLNVNPNLVRNLLASKLVGLSERVQNQNDLRNKE